MYKLYTVRRCETRVRVANLMHRIYIIHTSACAEKNGTCDYSELPVMNHSFIDQNTARQSRGTMIKPVSQFSVLNYMAMNIFVVEYICKGCHVSEGESCELSENSVKTR